MAARPQPTDVSYEITFLGDTLLGDRGEPMLQDQGYDWAFEKMAGLGSADLTVLNAEGPLTSVSRLPESAEVYYSPGSPIPRYDIFTSRGRVTRYIHRASPASAQAFANFGIDVVALGNNHALDQGLQGLTDTRRALEAAGVAAIGAGETAEEAARPYVVDTPVGRVGVFSFGEEGGTAPDAGPQSPGIRVLKRENVDAARKMARTAGMDWMVAVVHWGDNYEDIVPAQEKWAQRLVDRGFSLVVGTGPHVAQPIEVIGRSPVAYSIGNFAFLSRGSYTEEQPGFSLVVTAVLSPSGFRELRVTCIETDNLKIDYQTRIASGEDAARVLSAVSPDIQMLSGATGVIRW